MHPTGSARRMQFQGTHSAIIAIVASSVSKPSRHLKLRAAEPKACTPRAYKSIPTRTPSLLSAGS